MKKLILIVFLVFTLSSCIKIDYNMTMNSDNTVDGVMTMDYTRLNEYAQSMADTMSGTTAPEKKSPCENFETNSGSSVAFKVQTCKDIDENIAEVTGKGLDISDKVIKTDKGNMLYLDNIFSKDDNGQTSSTGMTTQQSTQMLQSMGFEVNYKFHFPTEIIETNLPKIDSKTVSYDLSVYSSLEDQPYVILKSDTSNSVNESTNFDDSSTTEIYNMMNKSKKELEKTSTGKKYIQRFDKLIPLLKNEKLNELKVKIRNIDKKSKIYPKYENLFIYLEAKILIELKLRETTR